MKNIIIERKGRFARMLIRTKYGIGREISKDRGSSMVPSCPIGNIPASARFFFNQIKIQENLLGLVKHANDVKIAPLSQFHMAFIFKAMMGKNLGPAVC